jgi:hypothetical protein
MGRQAGKPVTPHMSRARAGLLVSSLFGTIFILIDLRHMRHCVIDVSPFDRHTSPSNQILTHLLALATSIAALCYHTSLSDIIEAVITP